MRTSDEVFNNLGGAFFRYAEETGDPTKNSAEIRLAVVALGILVIVGHEAIKIIFRRNFGSEGLSMTKLIIAALAFGIISYSSYSIYEAESDFMQANSLNSDIITSIFYTFLAIYILVKGFTQKAKPNDGFHTQYRGDSTLLSFLVKGGWSPAKVQNQAEPLLTLALGVFLSAINLLWGLPLIFCAVSVWLHSVLESIMGLSKVRDTLAEQGYSKSQQDRFSEAKH